MKCFESLVFVAVVFLFNSSTGDIFLKARVFKFSKKNLLSPNQL